VFLAGRGAVRGFLDTVIERELLVQEARVMGLDRQPDVQKAREALRARRASQAYLQDEVSKKVRVSDEEITAAHARLGDRFQGRHILVDTADEARKAHSRIKAGEEFGEVAREVSVADSASRGGDLGIVQWGRLDPALEDRLWTLGKGQLSDPFETEDGWNLLYVTDRAKVEPPKLEQARKRIEATIAQRKTRERAAALLGRLMKASGSSIDETPVVAALRGSDALPLTTVVANAGEERITLERALGLVNMDAARRLGPERLRRQVKSLLEGEIFRILVVKEALARGYGDRPEVVSVLDKLTAEMALDALVGKVVLAKVEVTDADVEAYYREHPREFTEPEAVKLSAILVETEDEAKRLMEALAAGRDFASLARTASKDPSLVASGGAIEGWITRGKLDPGVDEVVFTMKEGALAIAKGRAGYFVVRLNGYRPGRLRPLADVEEQAREAATRTGSRAAVKAWVARLWQVSTIEIDDAAIDSAVAFYEGAAREKAAKRP
jgi:parvulin-like peptidyl-prolyl isomerase